VDGQKFLNFDPQAVSGNICKTACLTRNAPLLKVHLKSQ